jgi:flagellar assembly protein FliH
MSEILFERIRVVDAHLVDGHFRPMVGLSSPTESVLSDAVSVDLPTAKEPEPDLIALAFENGVSAAQSAFDNERMALQRLISSAEALQNEPSEELAALIAETVEMLVSQIVGDAEIDCGWLAQKARAAAAIVNDCDAARVMCLHPDDIALLEGVKLPLTLQADASAPRGSIRIDCSASWIEAGNALYLDALRTELGMKGIA